MKDIIKVSAFSLALLIPLEVMAQDDTKLAFQLTTLFRASRAVVTKNKTLITSPKSALKGKSPEEFIKKFLKKTKRNYKRSAGASFPKPDSSRAGKARASLVESISEVILKAVNGEYENKFMYSSNEYFQKGSSKYDNKFLPARYAVEVMSVFSSKTNGKILLKLTAPDDVLVKKSNAADDWERNVIQTVFANTGYERGTPFSEMTTYKGSSAYRQLLPEYYKKGCIGCHGSEPGQDGPNIHQSGLGSKLKALGGAISIIIVK